MSNLNLSKYLQHTHELVKLETKFTDALMKFANTLNPDASLALLSMVQKQLKKRVEIYDNLLGDKNNDKAHP